MDHYPRQPGLSNNEILEDDDTTKRPPTLLELNTPQERTWRRLWSQCVYLVYLPNGSMVNTVQLYRSLGDELADPSDDAHDFYLVTRPRTLEAPIGSIYHWSVYCNGHFYHLCAPDLPRQSGGKSKNALLRREVACQLRHEDLGQAGTVDYMRIAQAPKRKALLAYKVGQTEYKPSQILRIAQHVVSTLPVYGLFSANCQHFVSGMIRRCLMRLSDRSSLLGTAVHIRDWDMRDRNELHVDNVEHGFVMSPPRPSKLSVPQL